MALSVGPASAQSPGPFEALLLTGGRVWTGDPARPEASEILIIGERIAWVGEPSGRPAQAAGARTTDLGGRRAIPGFDDAHTHFFNGAFALLAPDLLHTDTPAEFAARLKGYAESLPAGRWIDLSAAWDHERWPGHLLPDRALIDSVTGDHPAWMTRPDEHIGLANSLALEAAGIDADTPDPSGGQIDRDPATGEPTGILRDAGQLVRKAIPPRSEAEYREALDAGLAHAARLGVTTLQDMCYDPGPIEIRLLEEYLRAGKLTARFYCRTWLPDWEEPAGVGITAGFGGDWIRLGSLKAFADGGLGASTAYFLEPYESQGDYRGYLDELFQPPEKFLALAAPADSARLQLSIHAIGDAAISLVLDQFEKIRARNAPWDRRWRIEHAQHMAPADFARMADLGVIASVQPYHAIDDGRWAERKIGPRRAKTTYAFRSFLDAGVALALGTDWPVAPLDPMWTVYAAVTRRTLDGKHPGGWVPEEKLTLEEALRAYTAGSAYAAFAEGDEGRLAPGYLADVVVLEPDPFAVPPEELKDVTAWMTIVGGRVVYAAEDTPRD